MKLIKSLILLLFFTLTIEAQTVYITNSGAKYHRESCRYLSKSKIAIDLQEAIRKGYTPCSVCKPLTQPTKSEGVVKTATINTIIDGNDLKEIKIWSHRTERNSVVAHCKNGDKVTVLEDDGNYVRVKTSNGQIGWCEKRFVW